MHELSQRHNNVSGGVPNESRGVTGVLQELYLRYQYRWRPTSYLVDAYQYFEAVSPQFIADCCQAFDQLGQHLPHGWWPLVLYNRGKQYVLQGGRKVAAYNRNGDYEDALLRHVAQQGDRQGPIGDSLIVMRKLQKVALESEASTHRLRQVLAPLLKSRSRMAALLDEDDLVQEVAAVATEVAKEPWIKWRIRRNWPTETIQPTESFLRRVTERLVSRRYGFDRHIERVKVAFDNETAPSTEVGFETVELQTYLTQIMDGLPVKQREAVQIQYAAFADGISLEEKSRRLGRDPRRDRENLKAVHGVSADPPPIKLQF